MKYKGYKVVNRYEAFGSTWEVRELQYEFELSDYLAIGSLFLICIGTLFIV